jgi:hypothetical protein
LDRCVHPTDWLRQEIAHAIHTHRNIIPVLARGFSFPPELPADIATLPRHQGVEYSHMYHAAMINAIVLSVEEERGAAVIEPPERVPPQEAEPVRPETQRAVQAPT